jgi:hypothetical protein
MGDIKFWGLTLSFQKIANWWGRKLYFWYFYFLLPRIDAMKLLGLSLTFTSTYYYCLLGIIIWYFLLYISTGIHYVRSIFIKNGLLHLFSSIFYALWVVMNNSISVVEQGPNSLARFEPAILWPRGRRDDHSATSQGLLFVCRMVFKDTTNAILDRVLQRFYNINTMYTESF